MAPKGRNVSVETVHSGRENRSVRIVSCPGYRLRLLAPGVRAGCPGVAGVVFSSFPRIVYSVRHEPLAAVTSLGYRNCFPYQRVIPVERYGILVGMNTVECSIF